MYIRMEANGLYAERKPIEDPREGKERREEKYIKTKSKYSIVRALDTNYLNSNPGFIFNLL